MPIALVFLLFTSGAFATALVNRYQYISSETLPDGVWIFAFSKGQSLGKGDASFGSNGAQVSNQNYFSKDISYGNLLDEINDPLEKELAAAAFDTYGKDTSEKAGRVVNDVDVTQKSEAYVLGRGLTKRQSVFIVFPVVTLETKFSSQFNNSESLEKLAAELQAEGQNIKAQEILEKSRNALAQRLEENNYEMGYPGTITTLANIHLSHRLKAFENKSFRFATDSSVIVPAGKKSDVNDFLYLRINEEQYSYKQSLLGSYEPLGPFSLHSSLYYHKRFSFNKARRIPVNNISPLSNDIDPSTEIKYGDAYGTAGQLNFRAKDSVVLYVGQSFELKDKDEVSGNKFESGRYDFLEKRTEQNLSISYVGLTVNTIKSFLAKEFPAPFEMNLQYSLTQAGKNSFNNKAVTLNLMVFYK